VSKGEESEHPVNKNTGKVGLMYSTKTRVLPGNHL
jgi:hypothetical protein